VPGGGPRKAWQTAARAAGGRRRRGHLLADGGAGSWWQAVARTSGDRQLRGHLVADDVARSVFLFSRTAKGVLRLGVD
jgi:hypothetical protein